MSTLNIEILEDIGGWWGFNFTTLKEQTRGFRGDEIVVPVNTYGGDVLEALAIYNYLKGHKANVTVKIMGYAISAGTIIAMAGDRVEMPKNGYFMIHNPWMYTAGEGADLEHDAALLRSMEKMMVGIYKQRTGQTEATIRNWMNDETWFNGKDAKKYGFVDKLTDGATYMAKLNEKAFYNLPKELVSDQNLITNQNSKEMSFLNNIIAKFGLSAKTEEEATAELEARLAKAEKVDTRLEAAESIINDEVIKAIVESGLTVADIENASAAFNKVTNLEEQVKALEIPGAYDDKEIKDQLEEAKKEIAALKEDLETKEEELKKEIAAARMSKTEGVGNNQPPSGIEMKKAMKTRVAKVKLSDEN